MRDGEREMEKERERDREREKERWREKERERERENVYVCVCTCLCISSGDSVQCASAVPLITHLLGNAFKRAPRHVPACSWSRKVGKKVRPRAALWRDEAGPAPGRGEGRREEGRGEGGFGDFNDSDSDFRCYFLPQQYNSSMSN